MAGPIATGGDYNRDFNADFSIAPPTIPIGGFPSAQSVTTEALTCSGLWSLGTNPTGNDLQSAMIWLNQMLSSWNEQRWLSWHLIDVAYVADGNAQFTVGPGGAYNLAPRPARLDYAYCRQLQNVGPNFVDTPLKILQSREDFSQIALKSLVAFPREIFYDTAFPMGTVECYPIPNAGQYEIHLIFRDTWPLILAPTTTFQFYPPHAIPAMELKLARILRMRYGKKADPELNALGAEFFDIVKLSQQQAPNLNMPRLLVRPGLYNIFSDQTY